MKEIWKPVKDFEKYYMISNKGNLKSIIKRQYSFKDKKIIETKEEKYLKLTNDRGYEKIILSLNGKRYLKYIHRLVAEAFIPNPNNYKEVNHIDSDPSNNCVENLEWCDRKYNLNYMIKHQEEIKERNELRLEILENIFYGIEFGNVKNIEQVKSMINEDLLNRYYIF